MDDHGLGTGMWFRYKKREMQFCVDMINTWFSYIPDDYTPGNRMQTKKPAFVEVYQRSEESGLTRNLNKTKVLVATKRTQTQLNVKRVDNFIQ